MRAPIRRFLINAEEKIRSFLVFRIDTPRQLANSPVLIPSSARRSGLTIFV